MKRRNFVRVALGAATVATVVPRYLQADVEDVEEKYYEAFRQHCVRLCKEGYEIKWCRHSPIRDGRRFVEVFHAHGVVEFWMPWAVKKVS